MPELPEVETTCRGLLQHCQGQVLQDLTVWDSRLRWPVPVDLAQTLKGATLLSLSRRAKYLLFDWDVGRMIVHLGMSGSLRIITRPVARKTHDHLEFRFGNGQGLRYHDPRRFGCVLWQGPTSELHPLLRGLGPEPLSADFHTDYLHAQAQGRRIAIKHFLMDQAIVVGVGNIYANEALFRAGIHPARPAGRVSHDRYAKLVAAVREVLQAAIAEGGTTLRDFVNGQGEPGYFAQSLNVYEREGMPCTQCGQAIRTARTGQRSSYYCTRCQR